MIRLLASLLIALGLALAPAMMARASAASPAHHSVAAAQVSDHCRGAAPAKQDGKGDAKPCCSTACPITAALPPLSTVEHAPLRQALVAVSVHPVFAGLEPEHETPPPRTTPEI